MAGVEGESLLQHRCPTCSQVVTLSAADHDADAECPRCQAVAAALESLPASTPSRTFDTARRAVSDNERTHLILDAVPLEDDDSGASDEKQAAPPPRAPDDETSAPRSPAYDPERTHLILDPIETADDDDSNASSQPAWAPTLPAPPTPPATSSKPGSGRRESSPPAADDQPTRLFIDPAHLKSLRAHAVVGDDQKTHVFMPRPKSEDAAPAPSSRQSSPPAAPEARRSSPASSLAEQGSAEPGFISGASGGQSPVRARGEPPRDDRTKLMLGPILLEDVPVSVPPTTSRKAPAMARGIGQLGSWIDDVMHERWPLALVAAAIVCGLLSPFTDETDELAGSTPSALPSAALFIGLLSFMLAWASKLPRADEGGALAAAVARIQAATRLLIDDVQGLRSAPRNLALLAVGQLLALAGLAGLVVSSALALGALFIGSNDRATGVAFSGGLALLVGVSATQFARRASVVAPAPDELGESVSAARSLPPLVDLSEPLPPSFIDGHTPLHRILIALAQWRSRPWPDDAGYLAALERHFQRHLPASQVEREKWLGPSRSDGIALLVIDDIVLIEVARDFSAAIAARALARVGDLAPRWPAKPIILAIFDATREAVFQSAATSSLVNLHDDYPLLTVRMPEHRS